MRLLLVLASVAIVDACLPNTAVDDVTVQLSCAGDEECPPDFVCRELRGEGRCIASSEIAKDAIDEKEPLTLEPAGKVSPREGFNVVTARFAFTKEPTFFSLKLDGRPFDCAPRDDLAFAFECTFTVDEAVGNGFREVRLEANDAALNPIDAVGRVEVDNEAPRISSATAVPLAGRILTAPNAATAGTTLAVVVVFNEKLDAAPETVALSTGEECVPRFDAVNEDNFACEITIVDATPGPRSLHVTGALDQVRNSGDIEAPLTTVFDFEPPAAPDLTVVGAVVYERAPWGKGESSTPRFVLRVQPDVVEAGEQIAVFGDLAGGQLVAVGGSGEINLGQIDRPRVFVAAVDGAGQLSAIAPVLEQEWTATFGNKVGTRRFENPHQVFAVPEFDDDTLRTLDDVEVADSAPIQPGVDGALAVTTEQKWEQQPSASTPPDRLDGCLAFDAGRGVAVLFGGNTDELVSPDAANDTWTFDGSTWTQQFPPASPPPRHRIACAWDPLRDVVVVVGGLVNGLATDEIWEWDGVTWARAGASLPAPADDPAAAFDVDRGVVVVVDDGVTTFIGDDVVAGAAGAPALPSAVLVPSRLGLMLIGGTQSALLDGDDETWRPFSPLPVEFFGGYAFSDDAGDVFAFCGDFDDLSGAGNENNDNDVMLTLVGTDWVQSPALQLGDRLGAMTTNLDDDVLVFGGTPTSDFASSQLVRGRAVTPVAAFDVDLQQFTGGAFDPGDDDDAAGVLVTNNSGDLVRLTPAGFLDLGNVDNGVIVDGDATRRALLIGNGGVTNEFNPDDAQAFQNRVVDNTNANGVLFTTGARAVRRGDDVVFVDVTGAAFTLSNDVWSTPVSGGFVPNPGFALGVVAGVVVLHPDSAGHTWTFDGATWTDRGLFENDAGPGFRQDTELCSDVDDGVAYLFGGNSNGQPLDDLWQWDGAVWTRVAEAGPAGRFTNVFAYDRARSRCVLAGGLLSDNTVWAFDSAATTTAALRFAIDIGAAQVEDVEVTNVVVDAGGAEVRGWLNGTWAAPTSSFDRLLTGPSPTAHFAVLNEAQSFEVTFSFRSLE